VRIRPSLATSSRTSKYSHVVRKISELERRIEKVMNDPYDDSRIPDTIARMSKRYSTLRTASDVAHWHSLDYPVDDKRAIYWRKISRELNRLWRMKYE
jgi:hypothetical protein